MKPAIPPSFLAACQAIEKDELALALMHSDALSKQHEGCAEAAVLSTLIHRRAERASESWLESLLSSWASCGHPTNLTFLAGVSLDDEMTALAEATNPVEAIGARLAESSGIAMRLWMLNSPSVLLEGALMQLARPTDTLGRLFTAGQLAAVQRDPALRGRAAELRSGVLKEIATANPTSFELSTLPVIDKVECAGRLDADHVHHLFEALAMDSRSELSRRLFVDLVKVRRAETGLTRRLAWMDVLTVLPEPAFTVWRYAKHAEKTPDLLRLVERLGTRDTASQMVSRRILGLELLRLATPTVDAGALEALQAQLAATRRLTREESRFDPDWPIDPLLVEVTDAIARDEIGLLTRCRFP